MLALHKGAAVESLGKQPLEPQMNGEHSLCRNDETVRFIPTVDAEKVVDKGDRLLSGWIPGHTHCYW